MGPDDVGTRNMFFLYTLYYWSTFLCARLPVLITDCSLQLQDIGLRLFSYTHTWYITIRKMLFVLVQISHAMRFWSYLSYICSTRHRWLLSMLLYVNGLHITIFYITYVIGFTDHWLLLITDYHSWWLIADYSYKIQELFESYIHHKK